MNDRSEFTYALEMLRDAAAAMAADESEPVLREWLLDLTNTRWPLGFELYVACFCQHSDLLSQWRGYGRQSSRYCIRLDATRVKTLDRVSKPLAVIYDRDLQQNLIKTLLEACLAVMRRSPKNGAPVQFSRGSMSIFGVAMPLLATFKDPSFAEEHEWRFTRVVVDHMYRGPLQFVETDGVMKPYLVLLKGSHDSKLLPVAEVIAGTSGSEPQAIKSATLMLEEFGYRNTHVRPSSVPLRWSG
jgi:hypothetical protein